LLLTSGTSFQGGPPDTNSFVGRRITSVQRNPTAGAAFASQLSAAPEQSRLCGAEVMRSEFHGGWL